MTRKMSRTTIMAPGDLLDRLREIAKEEGVSLGEVIREGLEWRAKLRQRPPSFVGKATMPGGPHDAASHVDELVAEYLLEERSRY
jgi:DNA-binding transcriptional MocR family regulator